jgi:hypothetical protein
MITYHSLMSYYYYTITYYYYLLMIHLRQGTPIKHTIPKQYTTPPTHHTSFLIGVPWLKSFVRMYH